MATRRQAEAAATRHATRLAKLGAHQIRTVGQGPSSRTFAVQVSVTADFTGALPETLGCTVGGKSLKVPVVVKRAPMGAPE